MKLLLSERTQVPTEEQRLVYAGKVLVDEQTIQQVGKCSLMKGIMEGHTVYMARISAIKSFEKTGIDSHVSISESQSESSENSAMKKLLSSTFAKKLLSNPEIFKSMMLSNPQMKELVEKNPHINQMLNDPSVINDMIEMTTNPKYQKEMLRNHDRALNNLESIPEGFNALKKLYSNLQEPMYKAMDNANEVHVGNAINSSLPKAIINKSPLPNPWASKAESRRSNDWASNSMFQPKMFFPEQSKNGGSSSSQLSSSIPVNFPMQNTNLSEIQNGFTGLQIQPNLNNDFDNFEVKFQEQLKDLSNMGFTDKEANIRALLAAGGNVNSAVEYLLKES